MKKMIKSKELIMKYNKIYPINVNKINANKFLLSVQNFNKIRKILGINKIFLWLKNLKSSI